MKRFLQVLTVLLVLGSIAQTIATAKEHGGGQTSVDGGGGGTGGTTHEPGV